MLVNEQILTEYFLKWCDLNFGYKLTLPKFKFTNNFKYVARFECNVDSNNDISDETIFFSRQYDYTDHDLDNLMVHEMIHYYLCKIVSFGERNLTEQEIEDYHLSTLKMTYDEAMAEYDLRRDSKLGKLIANREMPVFKKAGEILGNK